MLTLRRHRLLLLTPFLAACSCDGDKPYTPFGVASVQPSSTTSSGSLPSASASAAAAPAFRAIAARPVATPGRTVTAGKVTLAAPAGHHLLLAATADLDGEGDEDVMALQAPEGDHGAGASVVVQLAGKPPTTIGKVPEWIPGGDGCEHTHELALTGPRTVTLMTHASCEGSLPERVATRAVQVFRVDGPHSLVELRLADPAPGETLEVTSDTTDRDGDGRDDATLAIQLKQAGSTRTATGRLAWLDRPAGSSQVREEPGRSLRAFAAFRRNQGKHRKGKTTLSDARSAIGAGRRLVASLCGEAGTPRVYDADGGPIRCGNLDTFARGLAEAEVAWLLAAKEPAEAVAAAGRTAWYPGKIDDGTRKKLLQALKDGGVEHRKARASKIPVSVQGASALTPRFSPLAFNADGDLIIQGSAGTSIVRGHGEPTPIEGRDRDLAVSVPGRSWTGALPSCSRSEVTLTFAGGDPAVVPILAPRPGLCNGDFFVMPQVAPLAIHGGDGGTRIEAIVAGSRVGPETTWATAVMKPLPPGTPWAPDGKTRVRTTGLGLLLEHSGGKLELWATPSSAFELADCTVASGATRVACTRSTNVLLFEPEE